MTAQIVFHGINRSAAVEAAVNEKLEGLAKFDNQIGPCKVTVTQDCLLYTSDAADAL